MNIHYSAEKKWKMIGSILIAEHQLTKVRNYAGLRVRIPLPLLFYALIAIFRNFNSIPISLKKTSKAYIV